MSSFLVGYELNKSGKDYEDVIDKIKEPSGGIWWHHLDSIGL